jgi:hypothetical protein
MSNDFKPKENAIIALKGQKKLFSDFSFHFEKAFSAYNKDATEDPINILTQQTAYNLFGLFTKRSSSIYREATKASLAYTKEKFTTSYNFEEIGKGYKTIGSNFYDNGYTSNTISSSFQPIEKLQLNGEVGLRTDRATDEKTNDAQRVVLNVSGSYQFSEQLSSMLNISNFRNTQRLYQRNINNLLIDSVSLALVNFNISTSTTYLFGKEKEKMISGLMSFQKSNSITKDTISTFNQNTNYLYNISYNHKLKKENYQGNISYMNNKNGALTNHVFNLNVIRQKELKEKLNLEQSIIYNYAIALPKPTTNIQIINGLKYDFEKNKSVDIKMSFILSNQSDRFRLMEIFIESNAAYGF